MTQRSQQKEFLRRYLNEHLAGAVAGIELTKHLISRSSGPQNRQLENLLERIQDDEETLKTVLERAGGSRNKLKETTSWLGEKLSEFKFDRERSREEVHGDVKELEALSLGIAGKRSLWTLFEEVFADDDRFQDIDFQRLKERAKQQYEDVDRLRLEAARRAFESKSTR